MIIQEHKLYNYNVGLKKEIEKIKIGLQSGQPFLAIINKIEINQILKHRLSNLLKASKVMYQQQHTLKVM